MGRGRGGSGRGGVSGSGGRSGRDRDIYAEKMKHATYKKEKVNSGLSKALGNAMFTYWEKNSSNKF